MIGAKKEGDSPLENRVLRARARGEMSAAPSGNEKERLPVPPAFLVSGKYLHDRYHLAQIRKLLGRLRE